MQFSDRASATLDQADALRDRLLDLFVLNDVTVDRPQAGQIRFRGRFLCDLDQCYDELRRRFEEHGFTPLVRKEGQQTAVIAVPVVFAPKPSNWRVNLVLLVLTILSTLFVAAFEEVASSSPPGTDAMALVLSAISNLWLGAPFSAAIMLILGAHELGHYFAARYHKVPVTLPYFIPLPLSIIGTMGAFIRLKAPIKNRRALLDIGAAGPLAGMVFALPILIFGLATSDVVNLPESGGYLLEGNSLLYALAKTVVFGRFLPEGNVDVTLNQVAWAGWVGLLVTGLNLFPVGQLDGGHVAYVLFGERARRFYWPVILTLFALVIVSGAATWTIWIVLIFFLGRNHAEPLDNVTTLDPRRRAIAIFTLALFFLVFVPNPLCTVGPGQAASVCTGFLGGG
jgi:membrane-associated protease RseP (regulator of RpoE activity)